MSSAVGRNLVFFWGVGMFLWCRFGQPVWPEGENFKKCTGKSIKVKSVPNFWLIFLNFYTKHAWKSYWGAKSPLPMVPTALIRETYNFNFVHKALFKNWKEATSRKIHEQWSLFPQYLQIMRSPWITEVPSQILFSLFRKLAAYFNAVTILTNPVFFIREIYKVIKLNSNSQSFAKSLITHYKSSSSFYV